MEVEVVFVPSAEEDLFSFHFPDLLLHLLQKILKLFPLAGRFPGTVIKMEMVKLGQGNYQLHHAITKTQKTILSSFGISLEDVQVYANQIARILKTKVKEAELEDEDYEDGEICDDAY